MFGAIFDLQHGSPHVLQVQKYESDELVYHGGIRVSFAMQMMAASNRIETELPNIAWPFFILHGSDDKLCDIRGSHLMHDQAKSTDKKIKVQYAVQYSTYSVQYSLTH